MKRILTVIIMIAITIMTISYLSDIYSLFVLDKFYEGYIFAIKVLMFDILMLIPFILILTLKNNSELKVWSSLSVLLQNCVIIVGFKVGAIVGSVIGFLSIIYILINWNKVVKKINT